MDPSSVSNALDQALLAKLVNLIETTTVAFDEFDYARALEKTEQFFWSFTDDYVELVKARAYGSQGDQEAQSAHVTLKSHLTLYFVSSLLSFPSLPQRSGLGRTKIQFIQRHGQ